MLFERLRRGRPLSSGVSDVAGVAMARRERR
jgi:hypothetical protein